MPREYWVKLVSSMWPSCDRRKTSGLAKPRFSIHQASCSVKLFMPALCKYPKFRVNSCAFIYFHHFIGISCSFLWSNTLTPYSQNKNAEAPVLPSELSHQQGSSPDSKRQVRPPGHVCRCNMLKLNDDDPMRCTMYSMYSMFIDYVFMIIFMMILTIMMMQSWHPYPSAVFIFCQVNNWEWFQRSEQNEAPPHEQCDGTGAARHVHQWDLCQS